MKKLPCGLRRLALFIIIFQVESAVTLNAQDTIIFKNNPSPVVCKILNVTETNIFYYSNGEYLSDYMSNVKYHSKQNSQTKKDPTPPPPQQEYIAQSPPPKQSQPVSLPANNMQPANQVTPPKTIPPAYDGFNPSWYIALSIGAGFPSGNYKDSGFAATGVNLSFMGMKKFTGSNFGTLLKIDYSSNPINQQAFLSYLYSGITNGTRVPSVVLSSNSTFGKFSDISVLAGFCVVFPANYLSFEIRAVGGLMFANTPAVNIGLYEAGNYIGSVSQAASSATSLSLGIGCSFRYRLTSELSAIASFDFVYAKPQFSVSTYANGASSGGTYTSAGTATQIFELCNLTAGLALTPFETPKPNVQR